MAIETFEYIDDLNAANPTATDNVSEGDDHLRGLKTTLKNTFPNVTGAINPTDTELNYVDGVTSAIQTQLDAKLPLAGGALTGAVTTNSTFDGVDIATRDGVLTSTTTTANAALPKAGGTMTGDTIVNDNISVFFGTGSDLEIMHDGAHSNITDSGTGDLRIRADNLRLSRSSDAELYMYCTTDAGVQIYHNGNEKLETTSAGIDVTGSVTCDSLIVQGGITEQQVTKTSSFTVDLTAATTFSCSAGLTITMPSLASGKSFTIIANSPPSWAGTILWSGGAAPSGTGVCIYTFISNGSYWYGMEAGSDFA